MDKIKVSYNGRTYEVDAREVKSECECYDPNEFMSKVTKQAAAKRPEGIVYELKAPIPGVIVDISITAGSQVKTGDRLLVLEAMKMENAILAPVNGTVEKILVEKGKPVNGNQLILTIR